MAEPAILGPVSAAALVRAVEENLFAFGRLYARWDKAETYRGADMQWCLTDVPFSMFNYLVNVRLEAARADAAIASVTERARARGVPLIAWTGPSARPPDLGRRLTEAGFIAHDPMPGMVIDLDELGPATPDPRGLAIERVTERGALPGWCRTAVEAFEMPPFVEEPFVAFSEAIGLPPEVPLYNFLGSLDGRAVAVASVFFGAGVAGLYNIATTPPARRRGIGRAITFRALQEARAAGYRYAILHASQAGEPLYRGMGFRTVCTLPTYTWPGDGTASAGGAR